MRRSLSLRVCLIASLCSVLVGGAVVFVLTRPWHYAPEIRAINVLSTADSDLLQVELLSHPPWSQQLIYDYAVNREAGTIDLYTTYVIWSPLSSLPDSDAATVPDFTILIPAEKIRPGSYQVRRYWKWQWTSIGTLHRDDRERLTWEPRGIREQKRSRRLFELPDKNNRSQ